MAGRGAAGGWEAALATGRPLVMAVVNLTPDSFSGGPSGAGKLPELAQVVAFGRRCRDLGVDILDLGGESTRPGATAVDVAEELERVIPAVRALVTDVDLPISVDTTKAAVARAACQAGASVVNDISGGLFDPAIVDVVAQAGAGFVCSHLRGTRLDAAHAASPPTFDEVADELAARLAVLPAAVRERTLVDPGIGFGKGTIMNLELLARAGELGERVGRPVLVGPSRKRFLGELTGRPAGERDAATIGACLAAVAAGARVLRVHEPAGVIDALRVFTAVGGPR